MAQLMMLVVIMLMMLLVGVYSYPEGAPLDACEDMIPQHPKPNIAKVRMDITIEPHQSCYKEGTMIMAKVTAPNIEIEGLLVMAHEVDAKWSDAVTGWQTGKKLQTLKCFGKDASAITHSGELETYGPVGLELKVPAGVTGDLYFNVTVVYHEDEYWTGISSMTPLSYDANCEQKDYTVPEYVDEQGNPRDSEVTNSNNGNQMPNNNPVSPGVEKGGKPNDGATISYSLVLTLSTLLFTLIRE